MVTKSPKERDDGASRRRGRPPRIDLDRALDDATRLMWVEGVNRLSLNDISARIGVPKPVLARAFGSKEAFLSRGLEHYYEEIGAAAEAVLREPGTLEDVAARYLRHFACAHSRKDAPPGCLLASATSDCAALEDGPLRDTIDALNRRGFETLLSRLRDAGAEDPTALAQFLAGQTMAMSNLARNGASREDLLRFATIASRAVGHTRR